MAEIRGSYIHELQDMHDMLLKMGTLVETAIDKAVKALSEQDVCMAKKVIEDDDIIDEMQKEIENRCLRLIALQQPMASDLRLIATGMKIVTDMERVADHAVDIARVANRMKEHQLFTKLIDIPKMAIIAQEMLRDAIDSYVKRDADLAQKMCERDDEVDELYHRLFNRLIKTASNEPNVIEQVAYLLSVAQGLERVADHATNIGEWVIYLVTGERYDTNEHITIN